MASTVVNYLFYEQSSLSTLDRDWRKITRKASLLHLVTDCTGESECLICLDTVLDPVRPALCACTGRYHRKCLCRVELCPTCRTPF